MSQNGLELFQKKFKGGYKKHFSLTTVQKLKTQKTFQVKVSLTLMRVKLVTFNITNECLSCFNQEVPINVVFVFL